MKKKKKKEKKEKKEKKARKEKKRKRDEDSSALVSLETKKAKVVDGPAGATADHGEAGGKVEKKKAKKIVRKWKTNIATILSTQQKQKIKVKHLLKELMKNDEGLDGQNKPKGHLRSALKTRLLEYLARKNQQYTVEGKYVLLVQ